MVIALSPQTESAAPAESGVKETQKLKTEKDNSAAPIGVFAKILAGLKGQGLESPGLKKTGAGEAAAGGKNSDVPLAETDELGEAITVPGGKGKGARSGIYRMGKAAAEEKIKTEKNAANGEAGPEAGKLELSETEKNVLLAVGRLTGQAEETQPKKTGKDTAFEGLNANFRQNGGESVKTETAFAERTSAEGAERSLTASSTAFAAGNPAENSRSMGATGDKARNRLNSAENGAKNTPNAAEAALQAQKAEAKKLATGEKDGKSKLEEARNRRRGLTFDVQDLRGGQDGAVSKDNAPLRVGTETRISGETVKDISLELRLPNQGQDFSSATTSWEAKSGQAFEDLLARELHQNFNNDIVRHASVALRDGNEATIRLALKPESLGNVKIRLEMAENKITGHIVVESEEALRAFEREISSLEKAFRDSGFEGANLEMSLAADGRGAGQQWQETEASHFLPGQIAASHYDAAVERIEMPLPDVYHQTRAINVLA